MSKKARRGMHIRIGWPILRLGVPEDFSNAESLTLHISRVNNNVKTFIPDTHMSIAGNVVSFIVTSEMQKALTSGEYKATISYRKVSATSPTLWEPYVFDKPCFTLVDSSEDLGGTTDGMEVLTIELDGEIGLPKEALPGASAYQIAVAHGFEGDESEWLYSLKKPALDAATAAAMAANAAYDAADAADAATSELNTVMQILAQAESGRVQAEQGRVNTESSRQQAEVVRNTNEGDRTQSETAREQAESSRVQAEQGRSTAEQTREQEEASRYNSETARKEAETSRSSAETARTQAEQARAQSEQARTQAETARTEAESSRKTAENSRTEAEQSRETAETARTQAEQARGTTFTQKIQESEQATTAANTAAGAQNTYNVTVAIPLAAGSYYNKTTARAAVPAVSRKLGLVITYATADKVWSTEKYIGTTVASWTTEANWEQVPDAARVAALETDLNEVADLLKYTGQWYGVEWDTTVSTSAATRIGNMSLHYLLPVQSRMRRCLLLDNGTVNYYLHPTDSTKKDDGSNAILDGTDGQVMVEIPEFYYEFQSNLTKNRVLISEYPILKYKSNKAYVSAYEASIQRSTNKLSSVVNLTSDYRGGNNNTAYDVDTRSLLGKPVTNISLTNLRQIARNRGAVNWNCYTYNAHKSIYWLYVIEYANFNCQLPFNPTPTSEGYRQGGLSEGVTNINATKWTAFNSRNPLINCGITNVLGNMTGIVQYNLPAEFDAVILTTNVPSYRGIENVFGHLLKALDGCKFLIQTVEEGGLTKLYTCNNPTFFNSIDYNNYNYVGDVARTEGYIKSLIIGEFGEFIAKSTGGSSTTYMSDYFYNNINAYTGSRALYVGGIGSSAFDSGISSVYAYYNFDTIVTNFGTRLCYIK